MEVAHKVEFIADPRKALTDVIEDYSNKEINLETGPDLIFLDINMPVMDGAVRRGRLAAAVEFLEEIDKQQEVNKSKFKIIILTKSLSMKDVEKVAQFENILYGYLTKPLEIEAVRQIITLIK